MVLLDGIVIILAVTLNPRAKRRRARQSLEQDGEETVQVAVDECRTKGRVKETLQPV